MEEFKHLAISRLKILKHIESEFKYVGND